MASTYTPAGIELITDGEQSNTWGQTTNTNWELMEEMATGIVSIALTSTSYTLTTTDGASSNGRHSVIVFTGSPGGTCTVTVSPNDMQKVYWIVNNSDQTVTVSQGSGANVSIAATGKKPIYCDGTGSGAAVIDLSVTNEIQLGTNWKVYESAGLLYFSYGGTGKAKVDSSGNLTVSGNVVVGGTV